MSEQESTVGDVLKKCADLDRARLDHNIEVILSDIKHMRSKLELAREERECYILRKKTPILNAWFERDQSSKKNPNA